MDRRRALTILLTMLLKPLVDKCLQVHGRMVRMVAEISPERNPVTKVHAIWLNTLGNWALTEISLTSIGGPALCRFT